MQLDLFENKSLSEIEMQMKIFDLKEAQDKLRRGIFQRYDDLRKTIVDLKMQVEELSHKQVG